MDMTALDTLQQLAQRDTDGAARQLRSAIEHHAGARQRLELLLELRAEYLQRLQQQSGAGLSIAAICNFRNFIDKLDDAIAGQTRLEQSASAQVDYANAGWQARKRAEMSWESLAQRGERAAALAALRLERKQMDEFASRAVRARFGADDTGTAD